MHTIRRMTIVFGLLLVMTPGGAWGSAAVAGEHETVGKVVDVVDGDTIRVAHDGKVDTVHLLHIDAPELAQPYGLKAKQYCQELCLAEQVRVVWEERDEDGALLGMVHEQDGFNVNFEMVKAGLAWDARAQTNDRTLAELETEARKAKRGLWADSRPVPPWEFRKGGKKQGPFSTRPTLPGRPGGALLPPIRW